MERKQKYEIGDIVFVDYFSFSKNNYENEPHSFIIIGNNGEAIDLLYFAFVISSQENNINENHPFNIPIETNNKNNLRENRNSHIECDNIFNLEYEHIKGCFGKIDNNDIELFNKLYILSKENYPLDKANKEKQKILENHKKQNNYTEEEMKSIKANQQKESATQEAETDNKKEGESIN